MLLKSALEYNKKQKQIIFKYKDKRNLYKKCLKLYNNTILLKHYYKIPRISMSINYHNRCWYTGRARGVFRYFGLSRLSLREFFNKGELTGVIKYSW